jgi:hypothetical protein
VYSNVVACAVVAFSAAGAAAFQAPVLGRPQLRSSATSGLRMVQAKEVSEREGEREGGRDGAKTSGLSMVRAKVGGCRMLVRASNQLPRNLVIWASSVLDLRARQQRSGCGIRSARPALTNPQTRP